MTSPRFRTGGDTSDIPDLPSGSEKKKKVHVTTGSNICVTSEQHSNRCVGKNNLKWGGWAWAVGRVGLGGRAGGYI